jgi:TolA-binding protein
MTEQQARVAEPIAVLRTGLEQVSQDTAAVRNSLDTFGARMTKMETQLTELSQLVRTLNTPPAAPPAQSLESADLLYTSAMRDYAQGNDDLALRAFGEFSTQYSDHAKAPEALYYMGLIYDRIGDFENAIKAYDSVVERYGETPMTRDARFSKANALMKAGRKEDAIREFNTFIQSYPTHPQAAAARDRLRELGVR